MKIRTESELLDKIDNEFTWRRTEMIRYKSVILDNEHNSLMLMPLLRSAIPILYAHWEGFIKECSLSYFQYVAIRKLKHSEISHNFLAVYINNQFYSSNNATFDETLLLLDFFENRLDSRIDLNTVPEPIKTKSNLNSLVLKEILTVLGLDYEKFRGFEVFIDSKLLEARNKIAHGEYRKIEMDLYDELYIQVLKLMDLFRTEVQNSVVSKKYVKKL